MRETAYAKVNLALHVRARETDGYHRLETLFVFADQGDELTVADAAELSLCVTGSFAEGLGAGEDNLVMRAARALAERSGLKAGARLILDKRLPIASGIGGGSADAAAALRLLERWWGLDHDPALLQDIAAGLGADVPACVRSVTCRGEGRGDRLVAQADEGLAGMPLLLVNPRVPLPTGPVFALWDGVDRGGLGPGASLAAARAGRNDLQVPATMAAPVVADVLRLLDRQHGLLLARMSGSGATCFGLFDTVADRDAAAAAIAREVPAWWVFPARLR